VKKEELGMSRMLQIFLRHVQRAINCGQENTKYWFNSMANFNPVRIHNLISINLMFFLTMHHELTIYWLPTWCTNYYLFI